MAATQKSELSIAPQLPPDSQSPEFEKILLREAPSAIIATDTLGRIVYWNAAAENLHGWTAAEAVGSDVRDLIFPRMNDSAAVDAVKDALLSGGWAGEVELRRENGSTFPAFLTLKLLGGKRSGHLVGTVLDFSERQKLEAQLLQSQKMEALGTLAGGMAHEFNNLLVGILGAASLAREEVGGSEDLLDLIDTVESAGLRGKQLVSQVLTFSRSEQPVSEVVDPNQVVKDLMQIIGRTLPKGMVIDTQLPPAIPTIVADRSRLVHALLNLCVNSRDAMEENGHLKINAGVSHGIPSDALNSVFEPDREFVFLEVEDDGPGMKATIRKRALDPFFTTKRRGQGTGLGLPLVDSTARAHGGALRIWSAPGEGTRVALFIPASTRDVAAPQRTRRGLSEFSGTETVLVVDDEAIVRKVSMRALERCGYGVLEAENGIDGLSVLEANPGKVDLVLLDMVMPEMDGREFFWALQESNPEIPVLLNSGFSVEGRVGQLLDAGAVGFLKKPYELVDLLMAVRGALDGEVTATG